jgi:branched-chain amino acid transport system substrate-binding protein
MKLLAALTVMLASLAFAACGGDDSSSDVADDGSASTSESSADTVSDASIARAVELTGGTEGPADESLPPFTVGFLNQQGGEPAFAEHEAAVDVAVDFINEHLGGIDGHPVELEKCFIKSEEDGQKCAVQFLDSDVQIAELGTAVVGNESFYNTVKGKFPTLVANTGAGADSVTEHVYQLDAAATAMIAGMGTIADEIGAKTVSVLSSDNPAGKFVTDEILVPKLDDLGIANKVVYVPDTATTPDYVSALRAADSANADAVLLVPARVGACISMMDALKQLGEDDKTVITTYQCYGDPFPEKAGSLTADWHMSGYGGNPRVTNDADAEVWRNVAAAYGSEKEAFVGGASKTLTDLLFIAALGNDLGFEGLSGTALDKAIQGTKGGEVFFVPGTMTCDGKNPTGIGVCGDTPAFSTFSDGEFTTFE